MKPYFLAIPAAVEVYLLIHRGWRATLRDLIPWAILAVAAGHLVLMFTVFSQYGRFVMPLALESYEPIGDASWLQVLLSNVMGPTLLALLIFGGFAVFLTHTLAARALLAFGIGAAVSAILQAKGWPYHVLPALSAAILLAALTLSQTIDRYLPISRSGHRLPVAVISATLMVLLYFQAALYTPPFYKQRQYEDSIGGILRHIVEQNAPHRTIMTLSPGIYPFWPMLNYINGRMTMRFLTMWVVQGVYADCEDFPALYNAPDTMGDTEKYVFDAVSEDFAKGQPDLLILDTIPGMPRCQGKVFDYLEYFQQNKTFADAFEHYEHLMDVDRYKIYRKKKKNGLGSRSQRPITLARCASGILSTSGILNTPDATSTISPPQTRSQLQKQKLMVRRAMRALPSSHWPSFAPRTNSVESDIVGCGQRMPVAWPEPAPITMSATVTSRPPCAQPIGLPWRGSSGRPTRRRSPSALNQSGPIRPTKSSETRNSRKPSGISVFMQAIHPWRRRVSRARHAPRDRTACCDASPRSATP